MTQSNTIKSAADKANIVKPRRSALYMPAINTRAMEKAQSLNADVIIFDLEDAVAPAQKDAARELLVKQLAKSDYGPRELVVRVNGVGSPWFADDVACLKGLSNIHGVALPKVESAAEIKTSIAALTTIGLDKAVIWPMIETPTGVFNAREIAAADPQVTCLIMGTSDLAKDLRLDVSISESEANAIREGLLFSLSRCVLAARESGIDILDGVCLDLANEAVLLAEIKQGRALGFTGKTLIHPKQLALSNQLFGINQQQLDNAREVVDAWTQAEQEGSGVVVVDGRLVESLHVEAAQAVMALASAIEVRGF